MSFKYFPFSERQIDWAYYIPQVLQIQYPNQLVNCEIKPVQYNHFHRNICSDSLAKQKFV